MNGLFVAIVCITISGSPVLEIRDSEPRSYEECVAHGTALAQTWAIRFEARPDIDHNNLPIYTLNCKEAS